MAKCTKTKTKVPNENYKDLGRKSWRKKKKVNVTGKVTFCVFVLLKREHGSDISGRFGHKL